MLKELLNGEEKSRFVLLRDTIQHRGESLLCHMTNELLQRTDAVIAFIFDEHPNKFHEKFNFEPRLICHDGFSDPLAWNKENSEEESVSTPFYLTRNLNKLVLENERKLKEIQTSGEPCKIGVVINSLSNVLAHQNAVTVSQDVFELSQRKNNVCNVIQVVALVHQDLHEEHILDSLNYIASTVVTLLPNTIDKTDNVDGWYDLVHCKKSGKVQRVKEGYKVGSGLQLKIILDHKSKSKQTEPMEQEAVDVTSGLTFNLSLTEHQKEARSGVQLPYLLDEKVKKTQLDLGKKGQIFYEADEVDDFDEEDPDDDLNI